MGAGKVISGLSGLEKAFMCNSDGSGLMHLVCVFQETPK